MKGFYFLVLLAELFTLSKSQCMDNDGMPLPSILNIPIFEGSASGIETSLNVTVATADAALAEIVSLSPSWTVEASKARVPLSFENTLGAIEKLMNTFWTTGYRLYLLSKTSDNEDVRAAAQGAVLEMRTWGREKIDFNMELFKVLEQYNQTEQASKLTGERRLLLDDSLKAYQRRGMALGEEHRAQLKAWQQELSELTTNISTTITMAVGPVEFTVDELQGLTDQQLLSLQYNSTTDTYTALTAIASQYRTLVTYANSSETRLKATKARMQRAMEENGEPMLAVLRLRQQIASLLGFQHWADYKCEDKMAKTGTIAFDFISNIDERLEDQFAKEQGMLLDLKREHLGDASASVIDRQDVSFYKNILLERDYQINHEEISEYFEEEATIRGIFELYEELFNIRIVQEPEGVPPEGGDAWADDVQFVYIFDKNGTEPLGGLYLDLHPREGKFTHFAKFSLIQGGYKTSEVTGNTFYQAPVCAIIGNWPVPVGNVTVSLWHYSNVNTMFHELGHALHTILTCAEFSAYAGTSVPRDFVEVPSQMLERWLDDIDVVRRFAKHYETGMPMPEHLLQSLIEARTVTVGHGYKGQVSFGLADLKIHTYSSPDEIPATPMDLYDETNQEFSRYYPTPDDTAFLAGFGHLFGGYDAGYYGYAWADAIAADLASLFRLSSEGFMDSELGAKFRKEILEPGGSRDPTESIQAFLGRDWNTDAFFDEMGLTAAMEIDVEPEEEDEAEEQIEQQEGSDQIVSSEPEVGEGIGDLQFENSVSSQEVDNEIDNKANEQEVGGSAKPEGSGSGGSSQLEIDSATSAAVAGRWLWAAMISAGLVLFHAL